MIWDAPWAKPFGQGDSDSPRSIGPQISQAVWMAAGFQGQPRGHGFRADANHFGTDKDSSCGTSQWRSRRNANRDMQQTQPPDRSWLLLRSSDPWTHANSNKCMENRDKEGMSWNLRTLAQSCSHGAWTGLAHPPLIQKVGCSKPLVHGRKKRLLWASWMRSTDDTGGLASEIFAELDPPCTAKLSNLGLHYYWRL